MRKSANYEMQMLEYPDVFDIEIVNDCFEKIDTQMKIINDNGYPSVTATGTNAYVATSSDIKGLIKGTTKCTLFVATDATGNCTLNLNSYGVKNIKDSFGNIVTNLKKDIPYNICYNGTDFILQGKGGGGNLTSDKLLEGYDGTGNSGPVVGSMPNKTGTNKALSINETWIIPKGFHDGNGKVTQSIPTQAGSTTTPGTADKTIVSANKYVTEDIKIKGDANFLAKNILDTVTLFGIKGTANIESLGGKKYKSGTFVNSGTGTTIDFGFVPSMIVAYRNDGNYTTSYVFLFIRIGTGPFVNMSLYKSSSSIYNYGAGFAFPNGYDSSTLQIGYYSKMGDGSTYTYYAFA